MDPLLSTAINQSLPAIRWEFSFRPFLEFTEAQIQKTENVLYRRMLEYMAGVIRDTPALLEPVTDLREVEKYKEVIELVEVSQASNYSDDKQPVYAIGIMNPMQFISLTDEFRQIMQNNTECDFSGEDSDLEPDNYLRQMYRDILDNSYGLQLGNNPPQQKLLKITETGYVTRHYHLMVNARFVRSRAVGELQPLQQEWVDFVNGHIESHDQIAVPLDFSRFVAEGFLIFKIMEATAEEAINELSQTIARMHTLEPGDTFRDMRSAVLSLLNDESIEMGVLPFISINGRPVEHELFHHTSALYKYWTGHFDINEVYRMFYNSGRHEADKVRDRPLVYNNDSKHLYSPFIKNLLSDRVRSMALFPLWHRDELLGVLEIASVRPESIDTEALEKVERTLPMFREFLVYRTEQMKDRINRFIMKQYTAIHPSVKWKFNEVAWQEISKRPFDAVIDVVPEVKFEQLYPFYGAVDIRNSSVLRQEAATKDFALQLDQLQQLLEQVVIDTGDVTAARQLEETGRWCARLEERNMLQIEEEETLQHFLLESGHWIDRWPPDRPYSEAAKEYAAAVRDKDSVFYKEAGEYERSLQQINAALKQVMENREQELQGRLPHYFEHFKTDGWEYNIYAGQSLAPWKPFPDDAFRIISRWQIDTIIDMAHAAAREKARISHELDTTQLIYTHANPIDIYFRTDERNFDVEGAYSIRYEVVKKRIDKVHIANTGERLTQPGTISIVYASGGVADIYRAHIETLIAEGRLVPGIEQLNLEELQGISGLKALRVRLLPEQ